MNKATIWAVVAGVLVIIVTTTLVDIALHVTGVFPPLGLFALTRNRVNLDGRRRR